MFISPSRVPIAGSLRESPCQIASNQPLLQSMLDGLPLGLLSYDKNQDIIFTNGRLTAILDVNHKSCYLPLACLPCWRIAPL